MLRDRSYATKYLTGAGIPIEVERHAILPPSSYDIFSDIMKSHGVNRENIENLWTYSGGISAAALMIAASVASDKELNQLLEKIGSELRDKNSELSWTTEQTEKRLAYTLDAIRIVYEDLKTKNYAYVALCCQPEGVAVDELALFCGCEYRKILTFNDQKVSEIYERISSQTDYEELRGIEIVKFYPTTDEKYDFVLDRRDNEFINGPETNELKCSADKMLSGYFPMMLRMWKMMIVNIAHQIQNLTAQQDYSQTPHYCIVHQPSQWIISYIFMCKVRKS